MTILNLLTKIDKRKVTNRYLTLLCKDVVFSFLLVSTFLAIIFVISNFILTKNFISVSESSLTLNKTTGIMSAEIKGINSGLKEIEKMQEENTSWVAVILSLDELIPKEEIQITLLTFNGVSKKVEINGKALTREKFLEFKSNLEESELFSEIKSPLTNILYDKYLNFKLEAKLN